MSLRESQTAFVSTINVLSTLDFSTQVLHTSAHLNHPPLFLSCVCAVGADVLHSLCVHACLFLCAQRVSLTLVPLGCERIWSNAA